MWIIIAWIGLSSVFILSVGLTVLVFSAPTNMPKWWKEWACRKNFHSFKLKQGYDYENEYPTAHCLWCGEDCVSQFGKPPRKFTDLREKILAEKS